MKNPFFAQIILIDSYNNYAQVNLRALHLLFFLFE